MEKTFELIECDPPKLPFVGDIRSLDDCIVVFDIPINLRGSP